MKIVFILLFFFSFAQIAAKETLNLKEWSYLFVSTDGSTSGVLNIGLTNRADFRKFITMWPKGDFVLKRGKEEKRINYNELYAALPQIPKVIPFPGYN